MFATNKRKCYSSEIQNLFASKQGVSSTGDLWLIILRLRHILRFKLDDVNKVSEIAYMWLASSNQTGGLYRLSDPNNQRTLLLVFLLIHPLSYIYGYVCDAGHSSAWYNRSGYVPTS